VKIILPKASKGLKFDLVFTVDLNDFDVEMLLPSLFHLVRTKGRRVGKPVDPELYQEYLARLAESDTVLGFGAHNTRGLLDRWIRTSVVKIGGRGRSHTVGEQMMYLFPTTMLTYKAGLPKEITRLRGVHNFIYAVLLSQQNDPVKLDHLFREALGTGLFLDDGEPFNGRYDGSSDMDLETMLSIRFLDQLRAAGVGPISPEVSISRNAPRLQKQTAYFAADILSTLKAYKADLPTTVLTRFLLTLINCHLFVYSLRLMNWVIAISNGTETVRRHEIFVDCTGQRGSYCDELARSCLERDLEMLERYARSSLRLRTLDRFLSLAPQLRVGLPDRETDSGGFLAAITRLVAEGRIEAKADQEFEQICAENGLNASEESETTETTEEVSYLSKLRDSTSLEPFDRLVQVLFEAQRKSGLKNLTGWFNSVAGLNRSYGLATGNTRGRWRVARYSLSNELLSTWVHAALADFGRAHGESIVPSARLPLRELLKWLEARYGVLINRPPDFDTSAEAVAAAHQNLESFKVRLRQIGVFQNLSDDFDAQYIQRPASRAAEVRTNA